MHELNQRYFTSKVRTSILKHDGVSQLDLENRGRFFFHFSDPMEERRIASVYSCYLNLQFSYSQIAKCYTVSWDIHEPKCYRAVTFDKMLAESDTSSTSIWNQSQVFQLKLVEPRAHVRMGRVLSRTDLKKALKAFKALKTKSRPAFAPIANLFCV